MAIKIGIVGFGKMGKIRWEALQRDPRCQVVGVFEYDSSVQTPEDTKRYSTSEELLIDSRIDAVFICTPNCFNFPYTKLALQNGKHVFCEKPPAFTSLEVQEIIKLEEMHQRNVMYGLNHRHHESVKKAKELIDSQNYGNILWMRGRYGKSVDSTYYDQWRAKKELAGGGILMDQGIHMLDLFLMFAGKFDEVKAYVSNMYWNLEVEDNVFALFKRKDNGVVASLHSTMSQWRHLFSLEIFLSKGYVVLNGLLTSSGTYGEEILTIAKNRTTAPAATWSDEEHFRFTVDTSWNSEITYFLDAITTKTKVKYGSSQDAYNLLELVERTYQEGRQTS